MSWRDSSPSSSGNAARRTTTSEPLIYLLGPRAAERATSAAPSHTPPRVRRDRLAGGRRRGRAGRVGPDAAAGQGRGGAAAVDPARRDGADRRDTAPVT